ncbi:MAG: 23S rRNA (adenine(2503)-C(2))-methyltransferase RlmN [Lachnospiraceae bacterium]|nr:23S rRNA (adenine(2503)-C(2))-methyltransferase RlmN [Lachnospiraceae bacterium]
MKDIKSFNTEELKNEMKSIGEPAFRAGQIFEWLHKKKVGSFEEMTNLSKDLRQKLSENFEITTLAEVRSLKSEDGTVKFLYKLKDGQVIESVLMSYKHGHSICVSSQVGCRMGCMFCASTIDGLVRNLTPSEILEQVYEAERSCNVTISNIVIMGSGEPMDNYDNVIKFIRLISDEKGKNLSVRNITLSTCGLVPGIRKLAEEGLPVTLALSLHAPEDELRKTIMPVAKAFSIDEILKACDFYFEKTSRRVTFEYSLIDGVNDSVSCAEKLARLIKGKNCHVNLIPINRIKERNFSKSREDNISKFKNTLEKNRINVTIRRSMGTDIDAACGQLRRSFMEESN